MSRVEIKEYSEKAIAVFGDTKPFSNELKDIGGKFNPSLTYTENDKRPGWIYSKKMADKVRELIEKINAGVVKPTDKSTSSSSYDNTKPTIDIKIFMALVSRVERLEQELKLLHNSLASSGGSLHKLVINQSKNEVVEEEVEEINSGDDTEEEVQRPKLLKNKK